MATSILQRKKDLVYLIFFVVHLPVMLGKAGFGRYSVALASFILTTLLYFTEDA
jgi:hypothetical protein